MCDAKQEQIKLTEQDEVRTFYLFAYHVFRMRQLLKCSICFDVFQNPVSVPNCIHIFCEECITTHLEYSSAKEPPCPICQTPILRNRLQPYEFLKPLTEFVSTVLGQISTILGSKFDELPSLKDVVRLVNENKNVKAMFPRRTVSSKSIPPPDLGLILQAKKVLVGPNNRIISSKEELLLPQPVKSSADTSNISKAQRHAQHSNIVNHQVSSNAVKDPFDALKQTPVQNPLFKNSRLNSNIKIYSRQKKELQSSDRHTRYADKVHEFENDANKNDIIRWLHDSRNKFDLFPLSQERNTPDVPDFDMPSVSQLHPTKSKAPPLLSQIQRQKLEQSRIRQKSNEMVRLSRSDYSKNKWLTQNSSRRTRSLECCIKTIQPKLRLKRHSITVCESPKEEVNIEQVNSEEEVIFTGVFKNPVAKNTAINLLEEEYLDRIEDEILKNKPSTSTNPMKNTAKLLKSPKRSKRISSKLLKTIEKTNERIKSSIDTSSGWSRMKEIKKTIGKSEKKPGKLTVVSRHSSLETVVNSAIERADKNKHSLQSIKNNKNKAKGIAIEEINVDNNSNNKIITERVAENKTVAYNLDAVESYFNKNLTKIAAQSSIVPKKTTNDQTNTEQTENKNVSITNKLQKSSTSESSKDGTDKSTLKILGERNIAKKEMKNDELKTKIPRRSTRRYQRLSSSFADGVDNKTTKKLEDVSGKAVKGKSMSTSDITLKMQNKNEIVNKYTARTETELSTSAQNLKLATANNELESIVNQNNKKSSESSTSIQDIVMVNVDKSTPQIKDTLVANSTKVVKPESQLAVSAGGNEVEMEILEPVENNLRNAANRIAKKPHVESNIKKENKKQESNQRDRSLSTSTQPVDEHKLKKVVSSPQKDNKLMLSTSKAKLLKHKGNDSKDKCDDIEYDIFIKPTQGLDASDFNNKNDIINDEDDIFNQPTQFIDISDNGEKEKLSKNRQLTAMLKQKIHLLNNIFNAFDDKLGTQESAGCDAVASAKTALADIERGLSVFIVSDEDNVNNKSNVQPNQLTQTPELKQSVCVQTDYPNEMSSLFSHSITTQTDFPSHKLKHVAMQTDSYESSRGFRISSTDMFNIQPLVENHTQTDTMMCPKCNYQFLSKTTNEDKSASSNLLRDADIKSLSQTYSLSASFDNINFETQDILKGKQIDSIESSGKSSRITQKYVNTKAQEKENKQKHRELFQTPLESDKVKGKQIESIESSEKSSKYTQKYVNFKAQDKATENKQNPLGLPQSPLNFERCQQTSMANISPETSTKTENKNMFKRIRSNPSSESDSDRDMMPRNSKRNKYVQDISLHFLSEPSSEVNQSSKATQQDGFILSEGSQGNNYEECLENILRKCEDDQKQMRPPKAIPVNHVEPPAKRFKTQDIIKECEMIIKDVCSETIRIENTENYNTNLLNKTQNPPSKLTLAALESEFQNDFDGDVQNTEKGVSKPADNFEISYDMELTPCVKMQAPELNSISKSKTPRDKFSESLFNSSDNVNKNIHSNDNEEELKVVQACTKQNEQKKLTKSCLDELINQFNDLDDSFEEDVNAEVESINDSALQSKFSDVNDKLKNENSNNEKIKILQNIIVNRNNVPIDNSAKVNIPKEHKAASPVNFDGNVSINSDEMFGSDVEIIETTPQKSQPAAIEILSLLSQAYYNPGEKMVLPQLIDESPDVVASCDPPPLSCLSKTFTPPPEFQDFFNNDYQNKDDAVVVIEDEKIDDAVPAVRVPALSSLTPDLLLPELSQTNTKHREEPLITSTPYMETSQIMSIKRLNLSPIHAKESNSRLNPISAAQTSTFSPLTIVKSKTPPPQRMLPINTSTPKQKSILSYVKQTENLNTSLGLPSQASQKSNLSQINRKPCVACTRMNKEQLLAITALSTKKLISYSNTFSGSVTHMVVAVTEHQCVKDHTMKFVSAVAAGIWVVGFSWIEECLKQGQILPEEPFEALDVSGVAGPKQSRLTRNTNPLLHGYVIHAAPPFLSTTQTEVENVILLLGGEVVPRPDDLISSNGKVRLIITEAKGTQDFELYEMWLETLKVVTVDLEWLSRSVGQYQRMSVRPFTLCSDDSLCDLGYPSQLIVEVPYSFSHTTTNIS